jgi:glycosyltransferase involved in cell wall biosynthesis
MQEIKKRRIVLASVLKPVNDPRMFEKIGQSLSPHYEVHIIGTKSKTDSSHDNIIFHPLASYARLSIDRIVAPLRILKKILYLKPALLIICTHELLWVVLIAKIFLRCPVVYDIRENYFRNILYTNSFPALLRIFIALYVRIKEWMTIPAINNCFLAEAGYEKELRFVGRKKIILENKVKKILLPPAGKWSADDQKIHLLFTGTLAPTTGIFVAIDLATRLHGVEPRIQLHIIGFSPLHSVYHEIKNQTKDKNFIFFKESPEPVSHVEILSAIQKADFGIIAYPRNLSTENTIPTKLFEYLGYRLPILLLDFAPWVAKCRGFSAAIPFHHNNPDTAGILYAMAHHKFYSEAPNDVFWEAEEAQLLQTVDRLLN